MNTQMSMSATSAKLNAAFAIVPLAFATLMSLIGMFAASPLSLMGLVLGIIGVLLMIKAKWRSSVLPHKIWTWGTAELDEGERKIYFAAYSFIMADIFLSGYAYLLMQ